jgi:hypothetical protein
LRKLATIREIKDIKPIDGADMIECCIVDGWECVIAKKDGFKVGDHIVYFEIDSILPEREEFEFLRDRKFRIRTIKLRKQISQGLVMPMSILPKGNYKLDDDVTEILGVKKHDPESARERKQAQEKASKNPIIKWLMRFKWFRKFYVKPKKGGFPAWIVKTDEPRIQNETRMFEIEKERGTDFVVTEKLDGQSLTLFLECIGKNKYEFGVCSRNLRLKMPDNSSWWIIAKQINAEEILKDIILGLNKDERRTVVLQGEIIGTGIQGNKYKIDGYDFYAFNLIINGKKHQTPAMRTILDQYKIKIVPILDYDFKLLEDIPAMVDYAKGDSTLCKTKREGVVLRSGERNISFKVINPEFLLAEKD